ncbi:DUF4157 domain-containing protein [Tahibacter soli]|uniref:DUF4157 domain-containing protein n=1 Tax=Tahibacter soli TaxID=2983605 RepID=A0A9X4BKF0_9GAMM|nr:DUF4157 domain-containing protein [Tahibacter soli]MDC8016076.1 DUF4157 domain-containing protein [Tahibacter soli]
MRQLQKEKVQAKFAVGAANDAFEREADAVADRVMRDAATGPASPAPVAVQRAADRATDGSDAPASVDAVLARGGAPLDAGLRADMEARFGHDFSHVRTHTDAAAERSAHEIDAAAYTAGHHVVFGRDRYAPSTPAGRRLIAHELTHVLQQAPGVVRRAPAPKPAAGTAKDAPKLDVLASKNKAPCACLVFIHHSERNARLIAKSMYESCDYNLAIVEPAGDRDINLPGHGLIDPNELFPRHVAEACWNDDKPCTDFMKANEGKTAAADVKAYAERQFFLAIKSCSKGFTLPVVGLHNNTIADTADYRKQVKEGKADLPKIEGKTFDKSLKRGDKAPADTLPFDDFTDWMKTRSGVLKPKKTNIFIWCNANDNTKCQIGDPTHPDNVVWVTNEADFEKLRGKKANVALQTKVDPKGNSSTDLSSLFVFLGEIVGAHHDALKKQYEALEAADAKVVADALNWMFGGPQPDATGLGREAELMYALFVFLTLGSRTKPDDKVRKDQLEKLRFVNIEAPHSSDEAGVGEADFRVRSLDRVRSTLAALGLDCCDDKPAAGQTESPAKKLENAVRAGAATAKAKTP